MKRSDNGNRSGSASAGSDFLKNAVLLTSSREKVDDTQTFSSSGDGNVYDGYLKSLQPRGKDPGPPLSNWGPKQSVFVL